MTSEVSKCDQVVFECMQKVAEVIVSSRVSLHQQTRCVREINSKVSVLHSFTGDLYTVRMPRLQSIRNIGAMSGPYR